ncbi:Hypothetical predicted protein, partial [Olea europaea subsp. europaea]
RSRRCKRSSEERKVKRGRPVLLYLAGNSRLLRCCLWERWQLVKKGEKVMD